MAINVTPPARARAAQHKPLPFPGASRGLPRDPVCPLPLPQDTGPQREGSAPGSAAVRCPQRCRVLRHRRVQRWGTAPVPALPSLGGQVPPQSRCPAPGPICSRGRLPRPGTAAPDGSGAEVALCQGAPDWLTGLRNGYLVRVKASDWWRGTCNASSEDAGVRVPARCRGRARPRREWRPAAGAVRRTARPRPRPCPAASPVPPEHFPPLRTAATCSKSNCLAHTPELAGRSCSSVSDLFRAGFIHKKTAE